MLNNRNKRDVNVDSLKIQKPNGNIDCTPRARVPSTSNKVYVNRPKSTIFIDIFKTKKKQTNRLEKFSRKFKKSKNSNQSKNAPKNLLNGSNITL